ncbi:MAG TPA: diguanylate cyclase [Thermoanaerobaculia bacterium]|nr:diguanylate cyclase [Thermoanaerobaculia bacterium]
MRTPHLRRRTDQETGSPAPLRALVVDNHDDYRKYIAELAAKFGFAITGCGDGAAALEILHEGSIFDLLIVDSETPRLSGLEIISAVRSHDVHGDIYAVMLTAREDVATRIEALRLGFDDFMIKSATELEIGAKLSAARRLISRQKRLDETVRELYGLATRDELTGLFNRRFFFSEAERLLSEERVVNLIMFDLDEFKWVNDTFGHLAGDRILRDIGALFIRRTRTEDLIARYGGDEFVMLVPDLPPPSVEMLGLRIAEEIGAVQWTFGTDVFSVGVTTGVACSSLLQNATLPQLLSAGDRDLYKNKWVRKNPDEDPSLYEYDSARDAHVIEMVKSPADDVKAEKK